MHDMNCVFTRPAFQKGTNERTNERINGRCIHLVFTRSQQRQNLMIRRYPTTSAACECIESARFCDARWLNSITSAPDKHSIRKQTILSVLTPAAQKYAIKNLWFMIGFYKSLQVGLLLPFCVRSILNFFLVNYLFRISFFSLKILEMHFAVACRSSKIFIS